jgi:hypothetical protein
MGIWWSMMGDWLTRSIALGAKFKVIKFRLGARIKVPAPMPIETETKDLGS